MIPRKRVKGTLEIDFNRGVIYFHPDDTMQSLLRVCNVGIIPRDTEFIDVRAQQKDQVINQARIQNHNLIDKVLDNLLLKSTIQKLVTLVDVLRQPYNNSKRHDLYLHATNTLNDLEERELINHD